MGQGQTPGCRPTWHLMSMLKNSSPGSWGSPSPRRWPRLLWVMRRPGRLPTLARWSSSRRLWELAMRSKNSSVCGEAVSEGWAAGRQRSGWGGRDPAQGPPRAPLPTPDPGCSQSALPGPPPGRGERRAQPPTPTPYTTRRVPGDGRMTGFKGLQPGAPGDMGHFAAGLPRPRSLQQGGSRLTDPTLQGGGGCGFGGRGLAVLQGAALVVHAAALELAQQVEEALLVGGRGPGDALRAGRAVSIGSRPATGWSCRPAWTPGHGRGAARLGPRSGPSSFARPAPPAPFSPTSPLPQPPLHLGLPQPPQT